MSTCLVSGTILDVKGDAVDGLVLKFFGDAPHGIGSAIVVASKVEVTTGPSSDNPSWAAGYFEVELIQGATVRLSSPLAKLDRMIVTVPEDDVADLADLIEESL